MTSPAGRPLARVRSFVRRGSRLEGQHAKAWEQHGEEYLVPVRRPEYESTSVVSDAPLDLATLFGGGAGDGGAPAPVVVEVGSGAGESLIAGARALPEHRFLGFEVWRPGLAQSIAGLVHHGVTTVRLVEADAAQAFPVLLAPGSVAEVWTFFPDPWMKAKHAKRRLINPPFIEEVARVLAPGGLWRIATDWAEYAEHITSVMGESGDFAGGVGERFAVRPVTRFERKGAAAGRAAMDFTYRRL